MTEDKPRLRCTGCGTLVSAGETYPFRCPSADGDNHCDHVLRPEFDSALEQLPSNSDGQPFVQFRKLAATWHLATHRGLDDKAYVDLVHALDQRVAAIAGHGFCTTPLRNASDLATAIGLTTDSQLWVKDETGNVAGSHKARHLMGLAIHLRSLESQGLAQPGGQPLAIASCGNAALAAAVLARAADRALQVFIPPDADPHTVRELDELGAQIQVCKRTGDRRGDPCYQQFRAAVVAGALPFGCQGPDNGLCIDGGQTLGYELAAQVASAAAELDAIVVQVGGGALASACDRALGDANRLSGKSQPPRFYTVQTAGAAPLARAYERLATRIAQRLDTAPTEPAARATFIREQATPQLIAAELQHAAHHRDAFMWAWESPAPSVAHGILDDETYDWLAVLAAMLHSGGHPVVVDEDQLQRANQLARHHTGIPVCPTGSAGLAGLSTLVETGSCDARDSVAIVFSGRDRS